MVDLLQEVAFDRLSEPDVVKPYFDSSTEIYIRLIMQMPCHLPRPLQDYEQVENNLCRRRSNMFHGFFTKKSKWGAVSGCILLQFLKIISLLRKLWINLLSCSYLLVAAQGYIRTSVRVWFDILVSQFPSDNLLVVLVNTRVLRGLCFAVILGINIEWVTALFGPSTGSSIKFRPRSEGENKQNKCNK
ncbi:hypothetical protein M9H77_17295 [Catharanthus roseus]|uniref:Uncharacterized protein n=1 Tax=Catharanthus roseus TaxID=4058 RepID=A0ACC0B467_CATRO|nr:hypothetical protein M9H77_17295 [Catharanthus roseus]